MGGLDGGDGTFDDPSMDFPGLGGDGSDMPGDFDLGMDGMDVPDPSGMDDMEM